MTPSEAVPMAAIPARIEGSPLDWERLLLPSEYPNTHAARVPDRVALRFRDHSWTYAQFDRAADQFVSVLKARGIGPGDRITYIGKNNDLFFIVAIGAARAGAVLVPVNWRNTAVETRYVLVDSDARLILSDAEFASIIEAADERDLPHITADGEGPDGLRALILVAAPASRAAVDPDAAWLQLYTSGTTGLPKGVLSSQRAFGVQRLMEMCSPHFDDWQDDEVLLSPLPSFHIGGLTWAMSAMTRGVTVVVTADTAPAAILDACLEWGITRTFIVPTLVRALIGEMDARNMRVPSLRGIHYGAAPMDPALLERSVARIGCRFLQYYGMTEVTGTVCILGPADHDMQRPHLLRSVGRVLPGFTIEIHGPDGSLLPIETPGEIWVRGPSLFTEYWHRPAETAQAMADGWFHSGDGGRIDAEGFLFLTDRIKDMVVSGGENVYPAEVEAVLRDHPAVLDCAVFGLPHPKWGEGVTAAIELRPGHTTHVDALIAHARISLAAYKIPRRIEIGVVLPRTASGKVKRGEIRQTYLDAGKA